MVGDWYYYYYTSRNNAYRNKLSNSYILKLENNFVNKWQEHGDLVKDTKYQYKGRASSSEYMLIVEFNSHFCITIQYRVLYLIQRMYISNLKRIFSILKEA